MLKGWRWSGAKKLIALVNTQCAVAGFPRPGVLATNPSLRRLHLCAIKNPSTRARQNRGLTVAMVTVMARASRMRPSRSVADQDNQLAHGTCMVLCWFFMLRPSECVGNMQNPGPRWFPLRWYAVRFVERNLDGSWSKASPTRAEAVLIFLPGRKTDKFGQGTLLSRWRSGNTALCPVKALAEWWLWCKSKFGANPRNRVFPSVSTESLRHWIGSQARGYNAYAMRVGASRHLAAHLRQGLSMDAMMAAGGWTSESMVRWYSGTCIESTRQWSKMLVQPCTFTGETA